MNSPKIAVSRLKDISIYYERDLYDLAFWLLRFDLTRSTPTAKHRHTLHGLAKNYEFLTRTEISKVHELFTCHGLPLGGTIERDEDAD